MQYPQFQGITQYYYLRLSIVALSLLARVLHVVVVASAAHAVAAEAGCFDFGAAQEVGEGFGDQRGLRPRVDCDLPGLGLPVPGITEPDEEFVVDPFRGLGGLERVTLLDHGLCLAVDPEAVSKNPHLGKGLFVGHTAYHTPLKVLASSVYWWRYSSPLTVVLKRVWLSEG